MRCCISFLALVLAAGVCRGGVGLADQEGQDCLHAGNPEQVLSRINALRAQAQQCGAELKAPAPPLQWDSRLQASALAYAVELSQQSRLSHVSALGQTVRKRFLNQGYVFRRAGENLAGGQESLDEVMLTWIGSTGHCDNIMEPQFSDVAMACVVGPGALERYWVMHLGRSVRD